LQDNEGNLVDVKLDMDTESESNHENGSETMPSSRDKRPIKLPVRYEDYAMFAEFPEPMSYTQAMKSENSHEWNLAMDDEIESLKMNNTWELIDKPDDRLVIKNRWVYKVKTNVDGCIEKFKARLVAKGYSQKAGIDYNETFSPVARFDTIRVVLSVAASKKLKLATFDIKTAFLYGELDEEIYMSQPPGYEDGTDRVCKLNKSLYGLKQSPRCWNKRFKEFLDKHGLKNSDADPCLFYSNSDEHKLIIAVYVDDGLVAYQNESDFESLIADLKTEFQVTVSSASCFLGLQLEQMIDGSIAVKQEKYTKQILQRFDMIDCNKVDTPMEKLSTEAEICDDNDAMNYPYREAVGSLMYLAIGSRPDIMFAVSYASQKLENPTKNDWNRVKRIFRYLKGTLDLGIVYSSTSQKTLTTYSDADFAGDPKTRKSTSGVVCLHMGGPVSWLSRRQKSIALSTTEAEFMAASEASKEVIWLTRLLTEIGEMTSVPTLFVDNMSAVKLVKNPVFHKRSKHIEVRYFFIREKVNDGELTVEHVPSESQLADILTKPLCRDKFMKLRGLLNIKKLS
jgi:hypothetical protein